MPVKASKKKKAFDKLNEKTTKVAGLVSAVIVLISAATALCSWVSGQFSDAVSNQISGFQQEVRDSDKTTKQATTRLELMILMEHDPDNVLAIERMAKYYFQELEGDLYMTQKVSDWCVSHNRDCTVIIGDK